MNPSQVMASVLNTKPRRGWAAWVVRHLLPLLLVLGSAEVQAQFTSTIRNGAVTITGYTGPGGDVAIPAMINGRPVTAIGESAFVLKPSLTSVTIPHGITSIEAYAFLWCRGLTGVTIPGSVTNIGNYAFQGCDSLLAVQVDPANTQYSSVDGILFDKAQTRLILCPPTKAGAYTIPGTVSHVVSRAFHSCIELVRIEIPRSVTRLGTGVFINCPSLTALQVDSDNPAFASVEGVLFDKGRTRLIHWPRGNSGSYTIPHGVIQVEDQAFYGSSLVSVTVPSSVTRIGEDSFYGCHNLEDVHFLGNAPSAGLNCFYQTQATLYYLPGTTGWGPKYADRPTELWLLPAPVILSNDTGFGRATEGFSFLISWATEATVVVEVSSNLTTPTWIPVSTNILSAGTSRFTDPQWANHPVRLYRVVSR